MISFYLSNENIKISQMLDANTLSNICEPKAPQRHYCGSCLHMCCYDVNGKKYPCQTFIPLSIGDKALEYDDAKKLIYTDIIPNDKLDNECLQCVCKNVCPMCIGDNYSHGRGLYNRDMSRCSFEKERFRAMAFLASKIYEKNKLKNYENKKMILDGILLISKYLKECTKD
jgi:sulfatase maturation enzyme AslB (radical SAM superfamily)